jgi:hypothetical protein
MGGHFNGKKATNQCGRLTDCNNSEISANAIFFFPQQVFPGSKQSIGALLMTAHDVHDPTLWSLLSFSSCQPRQAGTQFLLLN